MRTTSKLTYARAHQLFAYNKTTGDLTWRVNHGPKARAGDLAGCERKTDHVIIVTVDGEVWIAQRLVWFMVIGQLPTGRLIFKDKNPTNLKWTNILPELTGIDEQAIKPATAYMRRWRDKRRAQIRVGMHEHLTAEQKRRV